ncbi:MAG: DNA repair protein [Bacteroidetes bacterium]|nr:MAG: DNA repair protein [Bacteroidota bacterium]
MNSSLISKPTLFSFRECLWFLDRNYDECLHKISNSRVTKAIQFNNKPLVFSLADKDQDILIQIEEGHATPSMMEELRSWVQDWLDIQRDIRPFYQMLANHGKLNYMTKEFNGLRLIGIENLHESICWCIIGQQINLSFAYKLKRRLVEEFGTRVRTATGNFYLFPSPETLSSVSVETLKALQFSRQKADYIIQISKSFSDGLISKEKLSTLPDLKEKKYLLTSLKGVGEWTANYVLMKSLREPDCIPLGDIGLLNALSNHALIKNRKDSRSMEKLFSAFEGWKSYLVFYLWRSLAIPNFHH